MGNPIISVVIPTFNEEEFLPTLLNSLQKQTFSLPYEVIVVDNNSTDNTVAVARKYGATIVVEKKQGYANACNKGFYSAKGEIIARADADYVVPKNWLQDILNAFNRDPKIVAVGGPTYPLESPWWQNLFWFPALVVWMYTLKLLGRGFLFPNIAIKREAFLKTKGYNTIVNFGEDVDMCQQLKKLGKVELDLRVYVYTSMRRAEAMGVIKFLLGYGLINQIAIWRGKNVTMGISPIRIHPHKGVVPQSPWAYLIAAPVSLLLLGLILFYSTSFPSFLQLLHR